MSPDSTSSGPAERALIDGEPTPDPSFTDELASNGASGAIEADPPAGFEAIVRRRVDGYSDDADEAVLAAHPVALVRTLLRLLDDAEDRYDEMAAKLGESGGRGRDVPSRDPHRLTRSRRSLVLADFRSEIDAVEAVLTPLIGPRSGPTKETPTADDQSRSAKKDKRDNSAKQAPQSEGDPPTPVVVAAPEGVVQLQLSWLPGRIVAWAAGYQAEPEPVEVLRERLRGAGISPDVWEPGQSVRLPSGEKAESLVAPLDQVIGWVASLGGTADDDSIGASATWVGLAASLAVQLAAQGRILPRLRRSNRDEKKNDRTSFEVNWAPALVEPDDIIALSAALPHAVTALRNRQDPRAFAQVVLADFVDVIVVSSLDRLEVPAAPPKPTTRAEVSECFLAHLDGSEMQLPLRHANDLARRLDQWTRSISGAAKGKLVLNLSAPDDSGAWHLAVMAPTTDRGLEPVEAALVNASNTKRKETKDQLARLESLYPPLLRPGGRRRGEVILSQDEAWQLMTTVGDTLTATGFAVNVPALSRRKPTPALRLTSEEAEESVVGAQQLANVRWSVVFGDVELTASEIAELATQARPLVQNRGTWIELDKADLAQAAAALAERAEQTKLSGADMLRHALGLEGSPLAGGVTLAGEGWASDLLRSARDIPDELPTRPEGFHGELRRYQAEALGWLSFLDQAGLGGCLALDMGLGKTPTVLAHIRASASEQPALVIAPPAVVGNWANEARKFVPDLRIAVHHGPNRAASRDAVARLADSHDVIITTYGTAVRDIDDLSTVAWDKVVLDEAQAIKNPASDTARQLRRLDARTRVALTGTPIENGLGDLWAIVDFCNPGLVGGRAHFISQLSPSGNGRDGAESALRALNGILVFRRTKAEPSIAAELPDRIDELDLCSMTPEQIGLYQAVLDDLVKQTAASDSGAPRQKGAVLAAITALKQICNHPSAYHKDDEPLSGRSGKLERLDEIVDNVLAAGERMLIFTHFASWGERLATYLTERTGLDIPCYHGGLARGARDRMVDEFQNGEGAGALVLSLKAGGTGLNLTAANHVVLYDRWWNPAVEDQARDRVWRIGQKNTVICHRLVCPGTVDERVEEVVSGKRQIADLVLPKSSSIDDLDAEQLTTALGLDADALLLSDQELAAEAEQAGTADHASAGQPSSAEATV